MSSYSLQKLNNVHRVVARELALGIKLEKVCEHRALNFKTWRNIINAPLFQQEIRRLEDEIESQMIDDHCNDPVLATLRAESLGSAKRLVDERDNYDEETGASSSTRLQASKSILEFNGYGKRDDGGGNTVVINLSPEKLANIKSRQGDGSKRVYEHNFTEEDVKAAG